jgi:GcrA cell cycle regulator
MEDLRDRMCRWPNGDPQSDNFSFCGCKTVGSSPYCKVHTEIAYQVTTKARTLKASDFSDEAGAPMDVDLKVATG